MTTYPVTAATAQQTEAPTTGMKTLDQGDFLKLISVQMQAQDPMNPMKDTDFIAQMANFTSLEQMKTLSASFATFIADQRSVDAQSFLGKTVTLLSTEGTVTGQVSGITFEDGEPRIKVGDKSYDPAMITSIQLSSTPDASSTATN